MKLSLQNWRAGIAMCALAALSACGGSDGGTVSAPPPTTPDPITAPAPTPTPAPSPTPAPTLPSASSFQTPEYNRSTGPSYHRAIGAWQLGATGKGVAIGIVDTGLDTTNPEFAGRISAASGDVAGSRGATPGDDHGTMVALVAAAARNSAGVMGIAYEATVMALRADTPGSCAGNDGCTFADSAVAAGIDRAVTNGAKVINLSLGGGGAGPQIRAAVGRAASAGVVMIVAAGNSGDSTDPSDDPNNPEMFAMSLRAAGNGNVIIAGSVNDSGAISAFTNRAGTEANWYLAALGEQICCAYENGQIKVTTQNGRQYVTVYNGTSFSAPQIAGAAALLRQAFPNLTAAQVVNLLLTSARDAGASGVDATYGRGILDITSAFSPQGTTTLAGTSTAMPLTNQSVMTSAAMGDALAQSQLRAVVLDGYSRAYSVDLAANGRTAAPQLKLTGALSDQFRQVSAGTDALALAFSVDARGQVAPLPSTQQLRLSRGDAEAARVVAARIVARLSPKITFGFAYAQGAQGLVAQMRGQGQPAFLVASDPLEDVGFSRRHGSALALRQGLGRWGLTLAAESGRAVAGIDTLAGDLHDRQRFGTAISRYSFAIDRRFGRLDTSLGISWLNETRTILGAQVSDALGNAGAESVFLDAHLGWQPGDGWRLGASWRQGHTRARLVGLLAPGSTLSSNAWAIDATRYGVFDQRDSVSFRLSQPLRVASGGLNFQLPTSYSYDTLLATQGISRLSLTPRGRELAGELAWRGYFASGTATGTLFYRRNPGHNAALADDKGVAVSWSTAF